MYKAYSFGTGIQSGSHTRILTGAHIGETDISRSFEVHTVSILIDIHVLERDITGAGEVINHQSKPIGVVVDHTVLDGHRTGIIFTTFIASCVAAGCDGGDDYSSFGEIYGSHWKKKDESHRSHRSWNW